MPKNTPSASNTTADTQTTQQTPARPPKPQAEISFDEEFDRLETAASGDTGETGGQVGGSEQATGEQAGQQQEAEAGEAAPTEGEGQGEQQQPEDVWSGITLTPAQQAALDALNKKVKDAEQLAQRHIGQVSGLQRKINELATQQQAQARASGNTQQQAAPTAAEVQQAMQTPEGWAQLEADYPSIAKPIKEMLAAQQRAVEQTINNRFNPLLQSVQRVEQERQDRYIHQQVEALTAAHPDWQETKESEEFKTWLGAQSPMLQAGIKSQNAADAIQILDLYNSQKAGNTAAHLTQQRQSRLRQAASVPGSGSRAAQAGRPAPIPDEYGAAWDALERQSAGQR